MGQDTTLGPSWRVLRTMKYLLSHDMPSMNERRSIVLKKTTQALDREWEDEKIV